MSIQGLSSTVIEAACRTGVARSRASSAQPDFAAACSAVSPAKEAVLTAQVRVGWKMPSPQGPENQIPSQTQLRRAFHDVFCGPRVFILKDIHGDHRLCGVDKRD